jgi:hypothetical protein
VALQERIAGEWEGRNTWMTYDTSFLKTLTVSFFDDPTEIRGGKDGSSGTHQQT